MDLPSLKDKIVTKTLDDSPLIFKYVDNKFLANQYVSEICKIKHLNKVSVESLNDIGKDDIFDSTSSDLYVYEVDKLEAKLDKNLKNIIVICKDIVNDQEVDYTDFNKPINWQIEEFVKMRLQGLDDAQCQWLCQISNYDIYRLDNECKKLEIFNPPMRKIIFNEMNNDNAFSDLTPLTIFNFTNAILKKDFETLKGILSELETVDVEGSALPVILGRQFKNLIDIQVNPKNTAVSLGMKPNQYNAIKYNVGKFTNNQLIDMYEFITDIDARLKNGELTLKDSANHLTVNNMLVDYITCNLINIMTRKA